MKRDFESLISAGGRLIRVGAARVGDSKTGKNPVVGGGWQNYHGDDVQTCVDHTMRGGNVGVIINGSRLGVIDCDVDHPGNLHNNIDAKNIFLQTTLVIHRDTSKYRYKAFFEITDWKDQDVGSLRCVHNGNYDVFIPTESRQCVIAGKHYSGSTLISNHLPIEKVTFTEFRQIAKKITGWDVIKPIPISDYVPSFQRPKIKFPELTHPTCEEMLLPLLTNVKRSSSGWVNGCITGVGGTNAGFNPNTDTFCIFGTNAGDLSQTKGGWWKLFAILNDIDPDDKESMKKALGEEGYGQRVSRQAQT